MDRDRVMRWVAEYERAWRGGDVDGVERLFTEDARYRPSPYEEPEVGHAAIRAFWLDDEGEVFTVRAEAVAVEGPCAVVRLEVRYGDPVRLEYRGPVGVAVRRGRPRRGLRGMGVLAGQVVRRPGRPWLTAGPLMPRRRKHGRGAAADDAGQAAARPLLPSLGTAGTRRFERAR